MKKFLVMLILAVAILFGNESTVSAREYDFEWQFSCGDVFEAENDAGTRYKISAPSSDAITILSHNGGNLEVRFEVAGDFYIVAYTPDGGKYEYHLMVGGQENRTVIEQRIEGRNENFAQEVLRLVNKERARVGIAPLRLADDLQAATAIRAREIVGYFSHTRPNGSDCFTAMKNRGRTCGENIAAGNSSASATVEQWMNSQGHRANILNPAFRELGIGYFYAKDSTYRHYWVQLFRG